MNTLEDSLELAYCFETCRCVAQNQMMLSLQRCFASTGAVDTKFLFDSQPSLVCCVDLWPPDSSSTLAGVAQSARTKLAEAPLCGLPCLKQVQGMQAKATFAIAAYSVLPGNSNL